MSDHTTRHAPQEIPYGYCHCGCGQKTKIAPKTSRHHGWIKGEPKRFINGHNARKYPIDTIKLCACGCGATVKTRAGRFVTGHHNRLKNGRPVAERFWENVAKTTPNECWLWMGATNRLGYGSMHVGSKKNKAMHNEPAHRISYELHYHSLPRGMEVCHTCDNPRCVNPNHLFVGTHQDNVDDMVKKKRHTWGERNPQAKITEEIVRQIRRLAADGELQKVIAARFGLTRTAVTLIVGRKRWAHVE